MKNKKALIAFLTAGFPSKKRAGDYLQAAADAGVDGIEIGIPFSDPLADGPVIQTTSQMALDGGTTISDAFELANGFRGRGGTTPLYFMTYLNPVTAMGTARFFKRCRKEGLSGVILPELPPEEEEWIGIPDFPTVHLVSPTCSSTRIARVVKRSRPFVYLVALKGVTGGEASAPALIGAFVKKVRRYTKQPLYVGFGISKPSHAEETVRHADGVIVGTALLRRILAGATPAETGKYLSSLRKAVDRVS